MKIKYSTVEDLVLDKSFQDFVLLNKNETEWNNWVSENPDCKQMFNEAILMIKSLKFEQREIATAEINNEAKRLELKINDSRFGKNNVRSMWSAILRIAAMLIFGVTAFTMIYYANLDEDQEVAVQMQERSNPKGQKSKITLADGTIVHLNSESVVRLPLNFNSEKREIYLDGEAFFEVSKDVDRPFIVHTGRFSTTALGTSFNIDAYNSKDIEISLVTGKVDVAIKGQSSDHVILLPGQQAKAKPKGLFVREFSEQRILGWKDGILHFHEASLSEVITVLERWYNVDFKIINEDQAGQWSYSSKFDNEDIEVILKNIAYIKNFEFEKNDREINIKFLND